MAVLETERLVLREMVPADLPGLRRFLQDEAVMYAYEHAFSEEEVRQWLERQLERYARHGFGLWSVIEKAGGALIGDCGLTVQDWSGREVLEIGYHLCRDKWHQGIATEAAVACKRYAFDVLHVREVFSIIRENNLASQRVALRNGMSVCGSFVKQYYGMDMLHLVFSVKNSSRQQLTANKREEPDL